MGDLIKFMLVFLAIVAYYVFWLILAVGLFMFALKQL
jgi:hypothetical protein